MLFRFLLATGPVCLQAFCCALVWSLTPPSFANGAPSPVALDREIRAQARLEGRTYRISGRMQVSAPLKRTRASILNFPKYKDLIRYVRKSQWVGESQLLDLEIGVFDFLMISQVLFKNVEPHRTEFEFIGGHFMGLKGSFDFQDAGERGTWVTMSGQISIREGARIPPRFVIENGAQIVIGYTGHRMRTWIERDSLHEEKNEKANLSPLSEKSQKASQTQEKIPQPQKRLPFGSN